MNISMMSIDEAKLALYSSDQSQIEVSLLTLRNIASTEQGAASIFEQNAVEPVIQTFLTSTNDTSRMQCLLILTSLTLIEHDSFSILLNSSLFECLCELLKSSGPQLSSNIVIFLFNTISLFSDRSFFLTFNIVPSIFDTWDSLLPTFTHGECPDLPRLVINTGPHHSLIQNSLLVIHSLVKTIPFEDVLHVVIPRCLPFLATDRWEHSGAVYSILKSVNSIDCDASYTLLSHSIKFFIDDGKLTDSLLAAVIQYQAFELTIRFRHAAERDRILRLLRQRRRIFQRRINQQVEVITNAESKPLTKLNDFLHSCLSAAGSMMKCVGKFALHTPCAHEFLKNGLVMLVGTMMETLKLLQLHSTNDDLDQLAVLFRQLKEEALPHHWTDLGELIDSSDDLSELSNEEIKRDLREQERDDAHQDSYTLTSLCLSDIFEVERLCLFFLGNEFCHEDISAFAVIDAFVDGEVQPTSPAFFCATLFQLLETNPASFGEVLYIFRTISCDEPAIQQALISNNVLPTLFRNTAFINKIFEVCETSISFVEMVFKLLTAADSHQKQQLLLGVHVKNLALEQLIDVNAQSILQKLLSTQDLRLKRLVVSTLNMMSSYKSAEQEIMKL
ncbi:hypothetical protein BLNAU_6484 [Blattamonas nauphoetae]|uniref:Uncharacterized protein n=1 Tax=Blattamonas nauphoetae TaxID=2049346 RepID=A0ABQ9Y3W7_9EUKA|nr:hypothetical protein BLNAU_6484 [Blattamonas nauphoetae]